MKLLFSVRTSRPIQLYSSFGTYVGSWVYIVTIYVYYTLFQWLQHNPS